MEERVTICRGHKPIIIVAPHGAPGDDTNTDVVAEECAKKIDTYAVINRGFQKSDVVDVLKDKANCNNVQHLQEDVVEDEFLNPLKNFVKKINFGYANLNVIPNPCYIFILHGVGNGIEQRKNKEVDFILGFGAGKKTNSYSCDLWLKDYFQYLCGKTGTQIFEDRGGAYAGRSRNNLNQFFTSNNRVQSLQIEIIEKLRNTEREAKITGEWLADKILKTVSNPGWVPPTGWKPQII